MIEQDIENFKVTKSNLLKEICIQKQEIIQINKENGSIDKEHRKTNKELAEVNVLLL